LFEAAHRLGLNYNTLRNYAMANRLGKYHRRMPTEKIEALRILITTSPNLATAGPYASKGYLRTRAIRAGLRKEYNALVARSPRKAKRLSAYRVKVRLTFIEAYLQESTWQGLASRLNRRSGHQRRSMMRLWQDLGLPPITDPNKDDAACSLIDELESEVEAVAPAA
jgi:hypothetical protein